MVIFKNRPINPDVEFKEGQVYENQLGGTFVVVKFNMEDMWDQGVNILVNGKKWIKAQVVNYYYARDKVNQGKWKLLAEYPTWQEATLNEEWLRGNYGKAKNK